ncbi:endonuclease/exonuclease/phosphatase family protein [Streptomyces sp. NBC_01803]|uniref:endonuclease/exonuclease/phosphatase family protein n=1 Tax=Streptomyces sp. NBC_01803 TaxID=2975946 RepID=UPI002DDAA3AE|nr:endonuclease/exonuclease/phosphatase family protein [Streptomyces sp. NBC_01803]WSA46538.1 endonuclease/exonuclease/phosphatase family protein [Streptomyces sp. NBC_01803]
MARLYTPETRPDDGADKGAGTGKSEGAEGAGGAGGTPPEAEPRAEAEARAEPTTKAKPRWRDRVGRWRRGWVVAGLALALALVMTLHARVPNTIGNLGSLLQTFMPWLGLTIPVLALCAVLRRSVTAVAALLVPALVWLNLFGGLLLDKSGDGGALMVVSHNVDAGNADPAGTARRLAESGADLLALQELPQDELATYEEALAAAYPHHAVQGTVGLWSRYPLGDTEPVDIGMGWTRAMRTTVDSALGDLAVYVAHLPSVRVQFRAGFTAGQRDDAADLLGRAIAAEPLDRAVLLGDLNGTMNDGALAPLTSQLRSTQGAAGAGFGFSWPVGFPMARIDQILVRDLEPVSSWTLPTTGSDHLPVAARLDP